MGVRKAYWDYGTNAKSSAFSIRGVDMDAANFTVQSSLAADVLAATDAVSLGGDGSVVLTATETSVAKNPAASPLAQRENKWLVSMVDTNGNPVSVTIPCADLTLLAADGENMDATLPVYTDLVSAIEAYGRSNDGEALTVTSVKFRGRTL